MKQIPCIHDSNTLKNTMTMYDFLPYLPINIVPHKYDFYICVSVSWMKSEKKCIIKKMNVSITIREKKFMHEPMSTAINIYWKQLGKTETSLIGKEMLTDTLKHPNTNKIVTKHMQVLTFIPNFLLWCVCLWYIYIYIYIYIFFFFVLRVIILKCKTIAYFMDL